MYGNGGSFFIFNSQIYKTVLTPLPETRIVVGLVEKAIPAEAAKCPYFDQVVLMKDTGAYPAFVSFIFQYRSKEGAGVPDGNIKMVLYDEPPLVWNGFKGIGTTTAIVANCS